MKYYPSFKTPMATLAVVATMAIVPCASAQAQTSKKFGKALAKTVKGNYKELPSLKPVKEQTFDTSVFQRQNMKMPGQQTNQKPVPPTGVALGYGNSLLFRDMDKMKKDSLRSDSVKTEEKGK